MALPIGLKTEIQFTPGVWSDISGDVDLSAGFSTKFGRTSPLSTPQPGSLSLQLDNRYGLYTPESQVLTDGVTVNPHYPNVVPRKPIRITYQADQTLPLSTNLVTNGSFETNTSGWTVTGGTIAQSTAQAHDGTHSLLATFTTAGTVSTSIPTTIDLIYFFSVWVFVPSGQPPVTIDGPANVLATSTVTGAWQNLTGTYVATTTSTSVALTTMGAGTVYLDTVTVPLGKVARFTGSIVSWSPLVENGVRAYCAVTAIDALDTLSRVGLDGVMLAQAQADGAVVLYTLADASGATTAVSGTTGLPLPIVQAGAGGTSAFGVPGPDAEQLNGFSVANVDQNNGLYLAGPTGYLPNNKTKFSYELWFKTSSTPAATQAVFSAGDPNSLNFTSATISNTGILSVVGGPYTFSTSTPVNDGIWHHLVVTTDPVAGWLGYLDGTPFGSPGAIATNPIPPYTVWLGQTSPQFVSALPVGQALAFFAVYDSILSPAQVTDHYQTRLAIAGDTTGQRITRYLAYAGYTGQQVQIDPGSPVGAHPIALGSTKTLTDAVNDLVTTEGGGASFYVAPSGVLRFTDRRYRDPSAALIATVDSNHDLDNNNLAPVLDDLGLINSTTVTRQGADPQTATCPPSILLYGLSTESVTVYSLDSPSALRLAQWRVMSLCSPSLRIPQLTVDFMTGSALLYSTLGRVQIGARIVVTGLPPTISSSSTLSFYIEGWSGTASISTYSITLDVSPVDNPPRGMWGDPSYGRWNPDPTSMTLSSTITATATTLTIATVTGSPTFTTLVGSYPLSIEINEETLTLTAPPSGSTSPQTFTGVLRGQATAVKAPQPSGSFVELAPGPCWQL